MVRRVVISVLAMSLSVAATAIADRRAPPRSTSSDVEAAMDAALAKLLPDAGLMASDAGAIHKRP